MSIVNISEIQAHNNIFSSLGLLMDATSTQEKDYHLIVSQYNIIDNTHGPFKDHNQIIEL